MSDRFFRFPHTPHLAWLGSGKPRDDKVYAPDEMKNFLSSEVLIEEKVDGANLGISFDSEGNLKLQNRGAYLEFPRPAQFAKVDSWLESRIDRLFDLLGDRLIVFGEWCAAKHSLDYTNLKDWFLGFDVYDRQADQFWSSARRDTLFREAGIIPVQPIVRGCFVFDELIDLLHKRKSAYRNGQIEGLYLRREDQEFLLSRAKLVHPDFTQQIGVHWRRQLPCKNSIQPAR